MRRSIGVFGATMTLVGFVIGISIFILPGTLAATAGPAVVISYALAAFMALFSCVVAAQIGSIFPVSGASFVAVSRLLSPFLGFIIVWLVFGLASVAIALLGYGFADYLNLLFPDFSRFLAALILVIALGGLNLLGIKDTVVVQTAMVVTFMLALAVFSTVGLINLDVELLSPFVPNGFGPVLAAAIPAYFSFAGFMLIIEIGGEIKDPQRTIPRTLAISFTIVLVVYVVVSLVIVGIIPWSELGKVRAPLGAAASLILPNQIATAITVTAVAAAATSVNAMLLGYSRDVLALAKVGVLPTSLGKISVKHGEPVYGVIFMVVLAVIAVTLGGTITEYATLVVFGLLVTQIAMGAAALVLPRRMKQKYEQSRFRLGRGWLTFFSIGLIVLSVAFMVIAIASDPATAAVAGIYILGGVVCYYARRAYLAGHGIHMDNAITGHGRK